MKQKRLAGQHSCDHSLVYSSMFTFDAGYVQKISGQLTLWVEEAAISTHIQSIYVEWRRKPKHKPRPEKATLNKQNKETEIKYTRWTWWKTNNPDQYSNPWKQRALKQTRKYFAEANNIFRRQ